MSIHTRIKSTINALGKTTYQVAKELGENSSKFYNILNGKTSPSYETIKNLIEKYPDINTNYIFRGKLPILLNAAENEEKLSKLTFSEVNYLPIKFQASFISNPISTNLTEKISILNNLIIDRKNLLVIEIAGNSMYPYVKSGSKVLVTEIEPTEWPYIHEGIFAIIYREYFVIKRIKENNLTELNQLSLISDNVNFGNTTIYKNDIKCIFQLLTIVESQIE